MADDSFSPWDIAPEGFHRYDFDEASQFMNAMDFDRQYLLSDTDADQTNEEVLASAPSMASSIVTKVAAGPSANMAIDRSMPLSPCSSVLTPWAHDDKHQSPATEVVDSYSQQQQQQHAVKSFLSPESLLSDEFVSAPLLDERNLFRVASDTNMGTGTVNMGQIDMRNNASLDPRTLNQSSSDVFVHHATGPNSAGINDMPLTEHCYTENVTTDRAGATSTLINTTGAAYINHAHSEPPSAGFHSSNIPSVSFNLNDQSKTPPQRVSQSGLIKTTEPDKQQPIASVPQSLQQSNSQVVSLGAEALVATSATASQRTILIPKPVYRALPKNAAPQPSVGLGEQHHTSPQSQASQVPKQRSVSFPGVPSPSVFAAARKMDKPQFLHESYLAVKARGFKTATNMSGMERLSVLDNGLRVAFHRGVSFMQLSLWQSLTQEFGRNGTFLGFKVDVPGGKDEVDSAIKSFLKDLGTVDINAQPAVHAGTIRDHFQAVHPGIYPVVPEQLEKLPETLPAFEPLKKSPKKRSSSKADPNDNTNQKSEEPSKPKPKKEKQQFFTLQSEGLTRYYKGNRHTGFKCSDGMWRCLEGEALAAAQERTRQKEESEAAATKKRKEAPETAVDPKPPPKRRATKKQAAAKKAPTEQDASNQNAVETKPVQAPIANTGSEQVQLSPPSAQMASLPRSATMADPKVANGFVGAPMTTPTVSNQFVGTQYTAASFPDQSAQPMFNPQMTMHLPVPGYIAESNGQQHLGIYSSPGNNSEMHMPALNPSSNLQPQNQSYAPRLCLPAQSWQPAVQNQVQANSNPMQMPTPSAQFGATQQSLNPQLGATQRFSSPRFMNHPATSQSAFINSGMGQAPDASFQTQNHVSAQA
ncbi:hypothetical protein S40288_06259 [Stachybotrys chartarum IBT 40288]|nr:hypothetical protein S40288_06259 [Stachybotrys chartarum IBT 40288]